MSSYDYEKAVESAANHFIEEAFKNSKKSFDNLRIAFKCLEDYDLKTCDKATKEQIEFCPAFGNFDLGDEQCSDCEKGEECLSCTKVVTTRRVELDRLLLSPK